MVGSMPCGVRSRRRTPIAASRCEIDSDTADWDIARCDAAFAMLPQRTTVDRMWRSRSVTRRPIRFSQSVVRAIGITDRANTKSHGSEPVGPLAQSYGHDAPGLIDEPVPGRAAMVDEIVV